MTNLLPRPQQNLAEWAAVYVPVAHIEQVQRIVQYLGTSEGSNFDWLPELTVCGTLYTQDDINAARITLLELSKSTHRNVIKVTLDDVARLWWLSRVYEIYGDAHQQRHQPNAYQTYMRLLKDVKPFMLIIKQEILRTLLMQHTNAVRAYQPAKGFTHHE